MQKQSSAEPESCIRREEVFPVPQLGNPTISVLQGFLFLFFSGQHLSVEKEVSFVSLSVIVYQCKNPLATGGFLQCFMVDLLQMAKPGGF